MIMNTSAAYLQLHTCISLSSNGQKLVSNSPGHSYCSPLLLDAINFVNVTTQDSWSAVHLVNTEPLPAVQRAFGKQIYTDPQSQVSIYT
jgi:hypothetical protein